MNPFVNSIRAVAEGVHGLYGVNRWGIVTSVMSTDRGYLVKVRMQPDDVATGWIPVLNHFAGPGWGAACPPEPNMQAFIAPDMGDGEHGVVVGLSYSTGAMPPVPPNNFQQSKGVPVSSGEITFVSKAGAVFRLCSDGSVFIKGLIRMEGDVFVQGDLHVDAGANGGGDIYDKHGSLDRLRQAYDAHGHTNVKGGSDTSGPTNRPDPE